MAPARRHRADDALAACEELVALALEPAAQGFSGEAVVAVVRGDTLTDLVGNSISVAQFECQFEVAPRKAGISQVQPALEAMQNFELLETITLHADAKPLANDGMQVHETPTAQQLIQLRSARGMARRQPFEGSGLIKHRSGRHVHPGASAREPAQSR